MYCKLSLESVEHNMEIEKQFDKIVTSWRGYQSYISNSAPKKDGILNSLSLKQDELKKYYEELRMYEKALGVYNHKKDKLEKIYEDACTEFARKNKIPYDTLIKTEKYWYHIVKLDAKENGIIYGSLYFFEWGEHDSETSPKTVWLRDGMFRKFVKMFR